MSGHTSQNDRVKDGRHLMNVGRIEDALSLYSYYAQQREAALAMSPRVPWIASGPLGMTAMPLGIVPRPLGYRRPSD